MPMEQSTGASQSTLTSRKWLSPFVAPLAGALVFLPTLWYGFVWDDRFTIVTNYSLQSWRTLAQTLWGRLAGGYHMYRPVTGSVVFFQYRLFGLHSWGYHLTSILLHVLACALLFRLALQLSGKKSVAVFASLLFAVHATHLEAVAWVSAFAEPLLASIMFAGLSAFLRYRQDRHWKGLAAICLCLFLGLLTKETAIVLPLLLVCYEFTVGNSESRQLRRNLPLLGGVSGTVLVYIVMRHFASPGFIFNESSFLTFQTMMFTWPSLLIEYCRHLLIPTPLSPFYDSRYVVGPTAEFWLPLLLLVVISGAVYFASRRLANGGLILFCAIGAAICLIPVLNLKVFQYREIMHDRFLYLPSAFFAILVAELLFGQRLSAKRTRTTLYAALGVCLIVLNVSALLIQSPAWRNDFALYSYAVRVAPANPRPAFNLAMLYMADRGDLPQAERWFQRVLKLDPSARIFALLGQTRLLQNNAAGAEEPLRQAIAADPVRPGSHLLLGRCLQLLGRTDEAKAEFNQEMTLAPAYREAAAQELQHLPNP